MHKERVWQFVDAIVSSKLNDSISTHVSTLRTHEHGHELVHTPLNLQTKKRIQCAWIQGVVFRCSYTSLNWLGFGSFSTKARVRFEIRMWACESLIHSSNKECSNTWVRFGSDNKYNQSII